MLLKTIKLQDFRCYLGEVEIEFSTDPKRNITVIHGENGVGKTAMLNAIRWTFFDSLTKGFKSPEMLVNKEAKKEGRDRCVVDIEFHEEGRDFLIRRTYYQSTKKSRLQLWEIQENGTYSAEKKHPESFVNSIIPSEMAEYFFFQGEGSSAIDDKNKSGTLGPAIKNILGFRVAESLTKTLRLILTDVRKQIASLDKSGQSLEIDRLMRDAEEAIGKAKEARETTAEGLIKCEEELKDIDSALDKIKNKNLVDLRADERRIDDDLRLEKSQRTKLKAQKLETIKIYGWAVFGAEFADQSLDFIDESVISGKLPEPYNQEFISKILLDRTCICGARLQPGSKPFESVTIMLQSAANPGLQQRLLGINAQIHDIKSLSDLAPKRITDLIDQVASNNARLADLQNDLSEISSKIKDIPELAINKLQTRKRNVIENQKRYLREEGANKSKIDDLEKSITGYGGQLSRLQGNSRILVGLKTKQKFIDEMLTYIDQHLDASEDNVRQHVLTEVNNILTKFSRHDYRIGITDSNFKISLVDKDDSIVGQGDGLNLLLNLTITAALIKFASARRNVKDPILSGATVAPLVIDAPFGVLDQSYRNVVVTNLPDYTNQLVFFVSSSQWSSEMDLAIKERLGKEYCLVMEESSLQGDKKLDEITIRGTKLVLSKYGQEKPRTSILEIT